MNLGTKAKKIIFPIVEFISHCFPDYGFGIRLRGLLVQPFLKSCGRNLRINIGAHCYNPGGLAVGNNVYIGFHSYIGNGNITLEDEVVIGPFCSITAGNHTRKETSFRFGEYAFKDIRIGKGTWLASHCSVMPGVRIAEGNIIAAGAVVTKDTEPNALYAGVPAKKIKNL